MEILAEILFQFVGWLLQVLGELLVQVVFELFADSIGHGVKKAKATAQPRKPVHPALAAAGYAIAGAAAGAASLWILPTHFIAVEWLRWLNLLAVPVAAGCIMAAIGAWRRHRDLNVVRLDSFAYGYCFALAMGLVRFFWAG